MAESKAIPKSMITENRKNKEIIVQVRKNISTGIGFRLKPLELPPDSQLSHSDQAAEDVDEREFWRRMCRDGVLGGEGVAGNTMRVKGILKGLWVRGGVDVIGGGRRDFEPKTLHRGLRSAVR